MLAAALALVVIAGSEWSYEEARSAQGSLIERNRLRSGVQTVLRRLVDAETAQRGYLLTGREEYLEPYRNADTDVLRGLAELGDLSREEDSHAALERLTRLSRGKLAELATTIAMHAAGDHLGWKAVLVGGAGLRSMEQARNAADALLAAEDRRIQRERELIYGALDRARLGVHATTLLTLIWLIFFVRKNLALQRAQAEHAQDLRSQRDALELQVAARTEELRELNEHLQDVREAERSKLARQLHDDMGSLLTAAKLDLARLKHHLPTLSQEAQARLQHLGRTIDEGVSLKRRIVEELSPSALHNLGLRAALEIMVAEFRKDSGLSVVLDVEDVALADSPRIVVYRFVQECLDNLRRHAEATSASVSVRRDGTQVLARVRDIGRGFDPQRVPADRHGLRKLRHRVEALGGRLQITSAPGRGSEIEARLPLAEPGWDEQRAPA